MNDTPHPGDDRWLDLVNGLLDAEARASALAHARGCAACTERMRVVAAAHERLRSQATLRFGGAGTRMPELRVARRPWTRAVPALAAAAAVVLVAATMWLRAPQAPPRTRPLAPAPLPAPDASILTRNPGEAPGDSQLTRGLQAFARGDFADARRRLETAHATGSLEEVRRLYLGNALLQLGDARGAERELRRVQTAMVPEPWLGELQWSLAVALATRGEVASAESLRILLATRNDDVGARARRGWPARPTAP